MITGKQAIDIAKCGLCCEVAGNNCRTPKGRRLHHTQTHATRYARASLILRKMIKPDTCGLARRPDDH